MSEAVPKSWLGTPVALALVCSFFLAAIAATAAVRAPLSSPRVTGQALVVDGDTIEIAAMRIRLEGIDAPELAQVCRTRLTREWRCGREAKQFLTRLVAGRSVTCEETGYDKYGRMLGICSVAGRDLNAEMVRRGFAWAFVKYSERYVGEEAAARGESAGIWQAANQPAWSYREKRWQVAEVEAPNGCAIKGNISENGRLYHMPWSPWYGKVRIETGKGEHWFCSEDEAAKAGFRPAMQQ